MSTDSTLKQDILSSSTARLPSLQHLEPGVIPIFRRLMAILWALNSLAVCGAFSAVDKTPQQYSVILAWGTTGVLFLHLSNRWLLNRYPHLHLKLALVVISIMPVVAEHLANWLYLGRGGSNDAPLINSAGLYLWLILPLLLISTQYGMRSVLGFTIGTSLLAVVLAVIGQMRWDILANIAIAHAFGRLIVFLLTGFIVTRLTQSQRALRLELAEKNEQIAEYASRLEDLAIARERNRMARELHDTLAHTLSAVEVQLKVLGMVVQTNPAEAHQQLEAVHGLARSGLSEARRALHDLRARPIEEFGLLLALERLAERAADRTGIDPTVSLPRTAPTLSIQQQQQLYRIVEEALNNMVRHARATRFWLIMQTNEGRVHVTVKDNGVGFDADAVSEARYGVQGMRERAELIQAQLVLKSSPGKGTQVNLVLGAG